METTTDPNILNAIRRIAESKKPSLPWTRETRCPQPYYTFHGRSWHAVANPPPLPATPPVPIPTPSFSLLTWNIDFMMPLSQARMEAAVSHLRTLLVPDATKPPTAPTIIFLQETLASDLLLLQQTPWVRAHFHLTDISPQHWESGYYGTCTLIDKRLPISAVFRVHYAATRMERDALFVDIAFPLDSRNGNSNRSRSSDNNTSSPPQQIVRFCNTHLESLVAVPPLRPAQLTSAAAVMHDTEVLGSVLAGDLNAIEAFDATLAAANGLDDAYLALGGREGDEAGHTWGQQAQTRLREQFGCSRMDRVFFCTNGNGNGDGGKGVAAAGGGTGRRKQLLVVKSLERFGTDVEVERDADKQLLRAQGLDKGWVTDHLGVRADFELVDVPSAAAATTTTPAEAAPAGDAAKT